MNAKKAKLLRKFVKQMVPEDYPHEHYEYVDVARVVSPQRQANPTITTRILDACFKAEYRALKKLTKQAGAA